MGRIKLEIPEFLQFRTEIAVRINDINYGNHLGNDALLSMIHEARIRFLAHLDFTELDVDGAGIIMSDAVIIYKTQAFYGETLVFEVGTGELLRKSCDFFYRVLNRKQQIVVLCKTGIVFFDYDQNKPVRIPQAFREKIEAMQKQAQHISVKS